MARALSFGLHKDENDAVAAWKLSRRVNSAIDMQLAVHNMTTHGISWALHGAHVCCLADNSSHALFHCDAGHMMLM